MSWELALFLGASAAVFVLVFISGDDEPPTVRIVTSVLLALIWLPLLMLAAVFLAVDLVSDRAKRWFGK